MTIPADPRAGLVAALADAVKAAFVAGDVATARALVRTLDDVLGSPAPVGADVVDLCSERDKRGR